MAKNFTTAINVCETITKYSIYLLVFLLPVLFLPWTSDILDFNKQTLLLLLVLVALFGWMAKTLISGKLSLNKNKSYIAVLALFFAYFLSTIFSLDKYASFWGWPRPVSESLLTIICFAIFYFLISNALSGKEILKSLSLLGFSFFVAVLIGTLQLLGVAVMPFLNFTKSASFNTIGLVGSFGIFLTVLLPLLIVFTVYSKKWVKIIYALSLALTAISLVLINYTGIWYLVLAGSAIFIIFGALKKEIFDLRWLSLPTFFLVLALFFIILKPQIAVPKRAIEVSLNQQASLDIALKTLKDRPVFGSGPGTFVYDFSKYKDVNFNRGSLWNARFDSAISKILNVSATAGILGLFAFLGLLFLIIFYGFKFVFSKAIPVEKKIDGHFWFMPASVFIGIVILTCAYFFRSSNVSLDFLYFFLVASFIGLAFPKKRDYVLRQSSFITLGITFIFTILFIFGIGLLILFGQKYASQVYFFEGESALASNNLDLGIKNLEVAVSQNPSADIYLTELSQSYLSKALVLANKKDLSDSDKRDLQILINNLINASKIATDQTPNNVSNWSIRASVYQNLIGLIPGAEDWAITSYDRALQLEPINPYYLTQEGIILMQKNLLEQAKEKFNKAIQLKSDYSPARFQLAMVYQAQGKTNEEVLALQDAIKSSPNDVGLAFQIGVVYYQAGNYQNALSALSKAVVLNPNYANALYFLGLTYDKLGQKDKAVTYIQKVLQLNPDNAEVKKVLANLQAGKSALDGIIQQTPVQAPVQEAPPEKAKK